MTALALGGRSLIKRLLWIFTIATVTAISAQAKNGMGFEVLEDRLADYPPSTVIAGAYDGEFEALTENRISAKDAGSAIWLRFNLPATADTSEQRLLAFGPAYVDELRLYDASLKDDAIARQVVSGDTIPFFQKAYSSRLHVFKLPDDARTFYLRATSEGILNLDWNITSEQAFLATERGQAIGYSILLGILVTMILFNLGIFMAIGDRTYVYYVLYHISAAILIFSLAGYTSQFIWPNTSNSTNSSIPMALSAMCLFGLLFMRSFLDLPRLLPGYARLLSRSALVVTALAVPGLLLPYSQGAKFIYLGCLIVLVVMTITVVAARANNIVTARYLAITFGFAVLPGSLGAFGYAYGLLPDNIFSSHMLEITTVSETLLLSLFMAYRIKVSETEKIQAQQKNIALQRSFNERMLAKQEEERGRIARELHDSVGPNLSALRIHLQSSEAADNTGSVTPMLSNSQSLELLKATIDEVRQLSHNLHPKQLDDLSLGNALVMFTRQFHGEGMPAFKLQLDTQEQALPEDTKLHLFRIAQEAIQNVVNHAQASHCYVSLQAEESGAVLSVRDNGCGFSSSSREPNGLGMTSMADRANIIGAALEIDSAPGEGTRVTVRQQKNHRTGMNELGT